MLGSSSRRPRPGLPRRSMTPSSAPQRSPLSSSSARQRCVEELRTFEREYRTRLKSYLESQLRDLDASGKAEPVSANSQKNEFAEAQQS